MTAGERLTAGQVGERLGVKAGMVRRYALALEAVAGISLEVDPIRGRLYPVAAVELLEATRAHLLTHPGLSVEAAMRAVTGQSTEGVTVPPSRLPGLLHREELADLLREALAPALAPITVELTSTRAEVELLRRALVELPAHLAAQLAPRLAADLAAHLPAHLVQQLAPHIEASVRGTITPELLASTAPELAAHLAPRLEPITGADLAGELAAVRDQLARLEVSTHAALSPKARPTGLRGLLARLLGT